MTDAQSPAKKLPNKEWSGRSWHRRAARPVTVWMVIFIIAGLTHVVIPEYRWVLIHIFTLGVLTNSIVLWSQSLTEKFLQQKQPPEARPAQLARTRILNVGIESDCLNESGQPDMYRIDPLLYDGGQKQYCRVGEPLGKAFSLGRQYGL